MDFFRPPLGFTRFWNSSSSWHKGKTPDLGCTQTTDNHLHLQRHFPIECVDGCESHLGQAWDRKSLSLCLKSEMKDVRVWEWRMTIKGLYSSRLIYTEEYQLSTVRASLRTIRPTSSARSSLHTFKKCGMKAVQMYLERVGQRGASHKQRRRRHITSEQRNLFWLQRFYLTYYVWSASTSCARRSRLPGRLSSASKDPATGQCAPFETCRK